MISARCARRLRPAVAHRPRFHIAEALRKHLPRDKAARAASTRLPAAPRGTSRFDTRSRSGGMAAFLYMPHLFLRAAHGLDHFEDLDAAQHALTQRVHRRIQHPRVLSKNDPEPRLPLAASARIRAPTCAAWCPKARGRACRGRRAARIPERSAPVIELLELLKDDPADVRRSVANNLNDIGKDHPGAAHGGREAMAARREPRAALDRESRAAFGGETRRRRRAGRAGLWVEGRSCIARQTHHAGAREDRRQRHGVIHAGEQDARSPSGSWSTSSCIS